MALRIVSGRLMNIVGRGASYGATPTATPKVGGAGTLDSSYAYANVCNGQPATPLRWSDLGTDYSFDFTTNIVVNGDAEQGTTGWTASSCTLTSEAGAGLFLKGTKSLKGVTSAIGGGFYQDVTVHPGEYFQLWGALRSDGTNLARISVRNLNTGNYLTSASAWQASAAYAMTRATATIAAITPITFQVEDFSSSSSLGAPDVTLRIEVTGAANAQTFYADEVLLVPGFDFVGVFGHGFGAHADIDVQQAGADYWHSASWASAIARTDFFVAGQTPYYIHGTKSYYPYLRFRVQPAVAPTVAPWLGEVVLGQAWTVENQKFGWEVAYGRPGDMIHETPGGTRSVWRRNRWPRRSVRMDFGLSSDAIFGTFRDRVYHVTEGGSYPLIVVPDDTKPDALFCWPDSNWKVVKQFNTFTDTQVTLTEDALPNL